MKPELEKLCADYIANREAVHKAFRFDNGDLYSVCANIFCAAGRPADTDRLKECRKVIRKHTGCFSKFRSSKVRSILAAMLALGEKPEDRMTQANDYYRLLKRKFRATEYLVLTAFLLTDLAGKPLTEETAYRGKAIYRRMNQKHRILTDKTDSVFAMLMAYSGKSEDELVEEVESCYHTLKGKSFSSSGAQTAAQVLSMTPGSPEKKTQRLIELYDALQAAGIKYGRSDELGPLAALSLSDTPVPDLVNEISEADEFLKGQKFYDAKKDAEKRIMHAVMIVSDLYAETGQVNITVMTNTLDMLFAKQQASRISFAVNAIQVLAQLLLDSAKPTDKTEDKAASQPDPEKQQE